VATTRTAVREDNSWKVAVARCRNPPKSAWNARTKVFTSLMIWEPIQAITADIMEKPALIKRSGPRAVAEQTAARRAMSSVLRGIEEVQC
jgi:hypothetical protein